VRASGVACRVVEVGVPPTDPAGDVVPVRRIGETGSVTVRYRLRMARITRVLRTILLGTLGLMFVPAVIAVGVDLQWRTLSIVGLLSSIYGLRIVLGPAVEVRADGLRVFKRWPWRREIPWYRIYQVEVVPGYWVLDLELNSGEQLELPCVEHVDDLFERIEEHRQRLDLDA